MKRTPPVKPNLETKVLKRSWTDGEVDGDSTSIPTLDSTENLLSFETPVPKRGRMGSEGEDVAAKLDAAVRMFMQQFTETKTLINEMRTDINKRIETVKTDLEGKLEAVSKDITSLRTDCASKFQQSDASVDALNVRVDTVSHAIDNLERCDDLIVSGIPFVEGEDLPAMFKAMLRHIGLGESAPPSVDIRRLYPRSPSENNSSFIKIQFALRNARDDFYYAYLGKHDLKLCHLGIDSTRRVYVNESLTDAARKVRAAAIRLKKDGKLSKYGRGGGIVIYFKEHLGCKEVFRIEPSEETVDKTECLACELRFDTEKVLLLVVYNPPARSTYRDYVNFNADDVENGIRSVAWNEFYNFRNPNEMLDFFNSHVKRIHDQCIPLRTCSNRKKFNPWFNNDIKRSILERDMAYDDWRRAPPDRKTLAHLRYKTLRNKTNTLIDKAKSQYTTRFLDSTIPTKTLWKRVRSVGAAKDKTPAVCCFHPDDVNQAFLSSFIAKDNPRPSRAAETFRFRFRPVQHWEVVNAICDIRSNATGVDGLPICFIKIILPLEDLNGSGMRAPQVISAP
ncbi:hypothetical protein quinque_002619 [Culex quinquefasciatus]